MFRFDFKALFNWVVEKRPTIKRVPFNVYPDKPIELEDGIKLEVVHFNQECYKLLRR